MAKARGKRRGISAGERRRRLDLQVCAIERDAERLSTKRSVTVRDIRALRKSVHTGFMEAVDLNAFEPVGRIFLAVVPLLSLKLVSSSNGAGLNACYQYCRGYRNRRLRNACMALCRAWYGIPF